jgi:hypothetical protein
MKHTQVLQVQLNTYVMLPLMTSPFVLGGALKLLRVDGLSIMVLP